MTYFEMGQLARSFHSMGLMESYKATMQIRNINIKNEVETELAKHGSNAADELEECLHQAFADGWYFEYCC
jgi:hypothetical protein